MIFLRGLFFGMVLQFSVGPVCIAVFNQSVSRGFRQAFKMTWGVALVDAAYIAASFLGMARLLEITAVKRSILTAGALVLIYFGLRYIDWMFLLRRAGMPSTRDSVAPSFTSAGGSFGRGVKLTLTNPLTIIFWSGTFGSLLASGKLSGNGELLMFALGCVAATVLFLGAISLAGSRAGAMLGEKAVRLLNSAVGLFLIIFGAGMLYS